MAHRFNYEDSANAETVEHDIVLVNVDGRMVEMTADEEGEEDDSQLR